MAQAIKKMVKGEDGVTRLQLLDSQTLQPIPKAQWSNYQVQTANGFLSGQILNTNYQSQASDNDPKLLNRRELDLYNEHGNDIYSPSTSAGEPRTAENNYGYVDKGMAHQLASSLPGAFGFAGKAFNAITNANNVAAINAARQDLGLSPLSMKESISGIVSDRNGYIGDVHINGKQVAVGIETQTKDGRSTISVSEAKAASKGEPLVEATKDEVKQAEADFKAEQGSKGFADRALDVIGNVVPLAGAFKSNTSEVHPPATPVQTTENISPVASSITPSVLAEEEAEESNLSDITTSQENVVSTPSFATPTSSENLANVAYNMGPMRSDPPDPDVVAAAQVAVTNVLGPEATVSITSGKEAAGFAQFGSDRHSTGKSLDIAVYDSNGKLVTDQETTVALAEQFGTQGFTSMGYAGGYMGKGGFHLDTVRSIEGNQGRATSWGAKGSKTGIISEQDKAVHKAFEDQRTDVGILPGRVSTDSIPVPTARPTEITEEDDIEIAQAINPETLAPIETTEIVNPVEDMANIQTSLPDAQMSFNNSTALANIGTSNVNVDQLSQIETSEGKGFGSPVSPAEAAALGYTSRTPDEIGQIAFTLAGELSPQQLSGIVAGKQESLTELANMVTTVENRIGSDSKSFGGWGNTFKGDQYNSLMDSKVGTTTGNANLYQQSLADLITTYYEPDGIKPSDYTYTHYYNPEIVSPSWANQMTNSMQVGNHTFGVLDSKYDVSNPYAGQYEANSGFTGITPDGNFGTNVGDTSSQLDGSNMGDYSGSGFSGYDATSGFGSFADPMNDTTSNTETGATSGFSNDFTNSAYGSDGFNDFGSSDDGSSSDSSGDSSAGDAGPSFGYGSDDDNSNSGWGSDF